MTGRASLLVRTAFLTGLTAVSAGSNARARAADDTLPLQTGRSIRFSTDEASWLDLDLSPDGQTIFFELLGDLYTLPISGGQARRITAGAAYDSLPRVSPDGSRLAFVSDRDGGENVWVARVDGSKLERVTSGMTNLFSGLEWSPDGLLAASRGLPLEDPDQAPFPQRNYPSFEYRLELYEPRDGAKLGLKIGGSAMGPAFGSDPRYLFVSVHPPLSATNEAEWTVARYDRQNDTAAELGIVGRAVQPVVSPDNKLLVYGSRYGHGVGLRLHDLATGEERWLATGLRRDAGVLASSRGIMPAAAFTPDSRSVIFYDKGKIWRVEVASGATQQIPFTAEVDIPIAPLNRSSYRIADDDIRVAQIRNARVSPDGKRLVFTALNKLWLMWLPHGVPQRLTTDVEIGEHHPTWSADGRYIAYVGWREGDGQSGGSVRRVMVNGRSGATASEQLTHDNAFYEHPEYSPDGVRIVVNREPLQSRLWRMSENFWPTFEEAAISSELVWLPATGGPAVRILAPAAGTPMFTRDGEVIWLNRRDKLERVRWDGSGRQTMLTVPAASDLLISPSGKQVLALAPRKGDTQAYLLATPPDGTMVNLADLAAQPAVARRITESGAGFASWAADATKLYYSLGRVLFRADLTTRAAPQISTTEIRLRVPRDKPSGVVALVGARVLTFGAKGTIEDGIVLIRDNRIVSVGTRAEVAIGPDVHVIDVRGKTIIPGFIDTHGHLYDHQGMVGTGAVLSNQPWTYAAALAYGVTTNRDPAGTIDEFSYSDAVAAGQIVGPRIYAAGPYVTNLFNISSWEQAQRIAGRYADAFGTHYLKQYGSGERRVRQWLNMAAAEHKLNGVVEPYFDVKRSLVDAMDGYAELAHSLPLTPLYKDVIQVLAQTGISYTGTLMTMGSSWDGAATGALYYYTREQLLDDEKLRRFVPQSKIDAVAYHQSAWYADGEYAFPDYAAAIRQMIAAGVTVGIGSHGDFKGPGYHWELEMHAAGGIAPLDILRAATIGGAKVIGLDADIGSLETGKLADLQILDRNPLDDIRNVRSIRYVMKNGRLYESDTLSEVWPRQRSLPSVWWR